MFLRGGLYRIWLAVSALWLIVIAADFYPSITTPPPPAFVASDSGNVFDSIPPMPPIYAAPASRGACVVERAGHFRFDPLHGAGAEPDLLCDFQDTEAIR
jgi:hypothetical protein